MSDSPKGLNGWNFKETTKGTPMEGVEWLGFEQVNRTRARIVVLAKEVADFQLAVVLDHKDASWICSVSIKQLRDHEGHKALKTVLKNSAEVKAPLDIISLTRNAIAAAKAPDSIIPKGW